MKYFVKSNMYKASNVTFNPKITEATSYAWWSFVKKINGKVIFNAYNYSPSTIKHQYKVRALIRELGIKIDREVQVKEGLQYCSSIEELNRDEKNTLRILADREEEKRLRRNEKAKARRDALKLKSTPATTLQLIPGGAA